jgi:hypothetical protein
MNPKRIAKLLRERAALDIELADAFEEEEERKVPRKRPISEPTMQPSQEAIDKMRLTLRRKGVAA